MTDETANETNLDIETIRRENEQLQERLKRVQGEAGKFKRIAEKFEGVDLEKIQELQSKADLLAGLSDEDIAAFQSFRGAARDKEERQILEKGGIEALLDRKTESLKSQFQRELEAARRDLDETKQGLAKAVTARRETMFQIEVRDAVNAAGIFRPGTEKYVAAEVAAFLDWRDDDKPVLKKNGEAMFSPEEVSRDMSIAEFVKYEIPKIAPALMNKPEGVGAGGSGGVRTSDNPFMDRNQGAKQRQLRNTNPELAKKLAAEARAAGKGSEIRAAFD